MLITEETSGLQSCAFSSKYKSYINEYIYIYKIYIFIANINHMCVYIYK